MESVKHFCKLSIFYFWNVWRHWSSLTPDKVPCHSTSKEVYFRIVSDSFDKSLFYFNHTNQYLPRYKADTFTETNIFKKNIFFLFYINSISGKTNYLSLLILFLTIYEILADFLNLKSYFYTGSYKCPIR